MRPFTPPHKWIRWPFSPFATVVMIVFPLFWPVLAVILIAELFGLAMWLLVFVAGNLIVLAVMLAASLVRASRRPTRSRSRPRSPGEHSARTR